MCHGHPSLPLQSSSHFVHTNVDSDKQRLRLVDICQELGGETGERKSRELSSPRSVGFLFVASEQERRADTDGGTEFMSR